MSTENNQNSNENSFNKNLMKVCVVAALAGGLNFSSTPVNPAVAESVPVWLNPIEQTTPTKAETMQLIDVNNPNLKDMLMVASSDSLIDVKIYPTTTLRVSGIDDFLHQLATKYPKIDKKLKDSHSEEWVEKGVASIYGMGEPGTGKQTASGDAFNPSSDLTAALPLGLKIPLGTKFRLTNLRNGKEVELKGNDRGNFGKGVYEGIPYENEWNHDVRLDITPRVVQELGEVPDPNGRYYVRIEIIHPGIPPTREEKYERALKFFK